MPELKPEYQPGGSKRQHILDKAVEYLKDHRLFASNKNAMHSALVN